MHSTGFTVLFAAIVCVVCSIFVSGSSVLLKDRQEENKLLDRRTQVLRVAGLLDQGASMDRAEVQKLFDANIESVVVNLRAGELAGDVDAATFDQKKAAKDPATSERAPANPAKVARVPHNGLLYHVKEGDQVKLLVLPIEGKGLWSTLYGYLALDADANTVRGITFYQHGETPGLGGEVDNPSWKALWPGRKAFGEDWKPKLKVLKGAAGPVADDPYHVDGLSGATITSRGVSHLVEFWLDEHGFGPYLARYRASKGIQ